MNNHTHIKFVILLFLLSTGIISCQVRNNVNKVSSFSNINGITPEDADVINCLYNFGIISRLLKTSDTLFFIKSFYHSGTLAPVIWTYWNMTDTLSIVKEYNISNDNKLNCLIKISEYKSFFSQEDMSFVFNIFNSKEIINYNYEETVGGAMIFFNKKIARIISYYIEVQSLKPINSKYDYPKILFKGNCR